MITINTQFIKSLFYGSLIILTVLDGSASQREDEDIDTCCCLPFISKQRNIRQKDEISMDLDHPRTNSNTSGGDCSILEKRAAAFKEHAAGVLQDRKQKYKKASLLTKITAKIGIGFFVKNKKIANDLDKIVDEYDSESVEKK